MHSISVIIPWCDRPELVETLEHNSEAFLSLGAEVIIVNCGGDSKIIPMSKLKQLDAPISWLDLSSVKFNKCLANNYGVFSAKSESILLLDCDILLSKDTFRDMYTSLDDKTFVTVATVLETSENIHLEPSRFEISEVTHSIEFLLTDGRKTNVNTNTLNVRNGARSGPGIIMFRREDYMSIEGMKSSLVGWGWDDIVLIVRLQLAAGKIRKEIGSVHHISQIVSDPKPKNKSKLEEETRNYLTCLSDYAVGDFSGTLKSDIAENEIVKSLNIKKNYNSG